MLVSCRSLPQPAPVLQLLLHAAFVASTQISGIQCPCHCPSKSQQPRAPTARWRRTLSRLSLLSLRCSQMGLFFPKFALPGAEKGFSRSAWGRLEPPSSPLLPIPKHPRAGGLGLVFFLSFPFFPPSLRGPVASFPLSGDDSAPRPLPMPAPARRPGGSSRDQCSRQAKPPLPPAQTSLLWFF